MEIILTVPDSVAEQLGNNGIAARRILEFAAVEAYRSGELTSPQIQEMLGIDRFELDGLLKAHGILFDYSPDQLEREMKTIERLMDRRPPHDSHRLGRFSASLPGVDRGGQHTLYPLRPRHHSAEGFFGTPTTKHATCCESIRLLPSILD